jgi:flagellar biosynthesis anti-sigma factor FlgM
MKPADTAWSNAMKIDGNRLTQDTDATKATDAARKLADRFVTKTATERPATSGTDKVELSSDAKLLAAALKATDEPTAVRTDVVDAMKRKLAAGEIGTDSGRLADRILDEFLKR